MAQAQQDPYQLVVNLIDRYNQEPDLFSIEQVKELQVAAQQLGIKFSPKEDLGRMAKNFAFEAADTATFGLLPDELFGWQIKPDSLTSSDEIAGGVGGLLGFLAPLLATGGASAAATGGLKAFAAGGELGLGRLAGRMTNWAGQTAARVAPKAAAGAPAAAGKAFTAVDKALQWGAPYGRKAAGWLTATPAREAATKRALQFGMASGASEFFNDIGEGNLLAPIGRTFGGAALGGVAAGVGPVSRMVAATTKLGQSVGMQRATTAVAAAIFANMTSPEKEQYPQEFLEDFVKNAILAVRR